MDGPLTSFTYFSLALQFFVAQLALNNHWCSQYWVIKLWPLFPVSHNFQDNFSAWSYFEIFFVKKKNSIWKKFMIELTDLAYYCCQILFSINNRKHTITEALRHWCNIKNVSINEFKTTVVYACITAFTQWLLDTILQFNISYRLKYL